MKLIDNWRAALRHYSTIALSTAAGLQGMWAGLPDAVRDDLPKSVGQAVAWITLAIALGGLVGKFVKQPPKTKP